MADKSKRNLSNLLGGEAKKPVIQRGQGMRLSTEATPANAETQEREIAVSQQSENAETQKRRNAETQNSENAETQKLKRVNRGYMLREDLIKACKIAAVQEGRNLYEVMEQALEEYLDRRREP